MVLKKLSKIDIYKDLTPLWITWGKVWGSGVFWSIHIRGGATFWASVVRSVYIPSLLTDLLEPIQNWSFRAHIQSKVPEYNFECAPVIKNENYFFIFISLTLHCKNYFLNLCEKGTSENSGMSCDYYYIIVKLIFTRFHNNHFPLCTKLGAR